jgi:hypothetical protein
LSPLSAPKRMSGDDVRGEYIITWPAVIER